MRAAGPLAADRDRRVAAALAAEPFAVPSVETVPARTLEPVIAAAVVVAARSAGAAGPDAGGPLDLNLALPVVLALSLLVALTALVVTVAMLIRARGDKARSDGLVGRLSSAVHQTADAVFITDPTGIIEYVNPSFERMTGYPRREVIGKTPRILRSGEQGPEYYDGLWGSLLRGEPFYGTPVNRRRDGRLFHAEQTITPMTTGFGEVSHFVSVMRDLTDRRLIEEREVEMRLAASIQRRLLPQSPPAVPGWDLAGAVLPALATCGDYFDFIAGRDGRICVVVADACGHGVGPALIAVQTRAHLRSLLQADLALSETLVRLNRILVSDLDAGLFVTMAVACLDPDTGSVVSANAGHPTAYVFDRDGKVKAELASTGLPLGMLSDRPYTEGREIVAAPGDVVLMVSDGFLEAEDSQGLEFGVDRVIEVVGSNVGLSAAGIVQRLTEAVRAFSGGRAQQDDLTVVICRRTSTG